MTLYCVTMDDEKLAKYPGLQARGNGVWYVRKRVPTDLVHVEARSSIRLSLETTDKKAAIKLYPFKLAAIEQHFDALRNGLQSAGKVSAVLAVGKLERLSEREIEGLVSRWWAERDIARRPDVDDMTDIEALVADIEADARVLGPDMVGSEAVRGLADGLLVSAGMASRPLSIGKRKTKVAYPVVDRSTPSYRYLCELVGRALTAEIALAKDHLLVRRDASHDPLFNPGGVQDAGARGDVQSPRRLTDLSAAFRAERSAVRGEVGTEKKYGFPFRVMEEVLGREKIVSTITRADCLAVRSFFERLPPNAKKRFPKLTLVQAAEKAEVDNLPRLAPNSVGAYMQSVLAVLRWAGDEGWGVKINQRDLVGPRAPIVKRRGFRPDELARLFTGLAQFRKVEPAKFWVPALATFTGARAGELCQLRVEDVVSVQGTWCLNLSLFDADGRRVEDKRLKTRTSERFVPLHPYLLEAGFLAFVAEQKPEGRLFPMIQKGPDGRYSHAFSKWFGRFKKAAGFTEPALVFHSFRHGFRDACRHAEIPEETALALGGWASIGQATKYGDRGMVPILNRAMRKLDFEGFTLANSGK